MAPSIKASKQGLALIDLARRNKGWKATESAWCELAHTSLATLKRFRQGQPVTQQVFIELCQAVGINDWEKIVIGSQTFSQFELPRSPVRENLPNLNRFFTGRDKEIKEALEHISFENNNGVTKIGGIAGVGKTTLALEVAQRCLDASNSANSSPNVPVFDAIIFTSAKQKYLTDAGLVISKFSWALRDICRDIALTLDKHSSFRQAGSDQEQLERIRYSLAQQLTLLIVDNFETIEDKEEVLAFLHRLPKQVKVIVTTREQWGYCHIFLNALAEKDSKRLIKWESDHKKLLISETDINNIAQSTGGIPAAIVYTIGQVSAGYLIENILVTLTSAKGDIARFCFEDSVNHLKEEQPESYYLLMALAIFYQSPCQQAIAEVAGLQDSISVGNGLAKLQQFSLVRQEQGQRYSLLPFTREYALAQLDQEQNFNESARKRWIGWYYTFVKNNGGSDWREWERSFDALEGEWENIKEVLNWLLLHNEYEKFKEIWFNVDHFTDLYGHWSARLRYLNKLIAEAERLNDPATIVKGKVFASRTLILQGNDQQLREAKILLSEADTKQKSATAWDRAELYIRYAGLCLRQKEYNEADDWLNKADKLLKQSLEEESKKKEKEKAKQTLRQQITSQYYRAEYYLEIEDYVKSKKIYEEVLLKAEDLEWRRAVVHTLNCLADIAIKLENLDEAEARLNQGWAEAKRNKDKRRTVHYRATYAILEYAKGNFPKASNSANKALDGFRLLEMVREQEKMLEILKKIEAKA